MPDPKETLYYYYLSRLQSKGIKLFTAKPYIQFILCYIKMNIFFLLLSRVQRIQILGRSESFLSSQDSVVVTKGTSVERHCEDLLHD